MDRQLHYQRIRDLARRKRTEHAVQTGSFGVREIRAIYRKERVLIDIRKLPSCLKAIYLVQDGEASVAVQKDLPDEPKIFALMHELKHHWFDQELIKSEAFSCGDYNANELEEKGAEVFAAEFIYPDAELFDDLQTCNGSVWRPEDIVRFKRDHCRAKVSYTFIRKGLERRGLIKPKEFADVRFQKLEHEIYGLPFYRQRWFRDRRGL
jgi:Zn-dependent peptidase ImmA (M78 family)